MFADRNWVLMVDLIKKRYYKLTKKIRRENKERKIKLWDPVSKIEVTFCSGSAD